MRRSTLRNSDARRPYREVDHTQCGNVRNRECIARDVRRLAESGIQALVEPVNGTLAAFRKRRYGIDRTHVTRETARCKSGEGIAERFRSTEQAIEFHMPLTRLDTRFADGICAHQRRLWMRFFDVAAYR